MDEIMNGETMADVPALIDDNIVAVAEQAEKRIAAVKKIKETALKITNRSDWTDQGGKPYLQVSGSEKVGRLFGVSWRIDEPTKDDLGEGHYSYTYKGEFSIGGAKIQVIGTRSSKDPFFSVRNEWVEGDDGKRTKNKTHLPASEVDAGNVKKGALTNCLGNGITRLLGIRNMTWEEIESVTGFGRDDVSKVQYGDKKGKDNKSQGGGGKGKASPAQVKKLCAMLNKDKIDFNDFKKANKVESFDDIPVGRMSKMFDDWDGTVKQFKSWKVAQEQAKDLTGDSGGDKNESDPEEPCPQTGNPPVKFDCGGCSEKEGCHVALS